MTDRKMAERTVCKFYNTGYCKLTKKCKFEHPKNKCTEITCKSKSCRKRHPKQCRYKEQCRRQSSCLYNHEELNKVIELTLENLKNEIEELKKQNNELKKKISIVDIENVNKKL